VRLYRSAGKAVFLCAGHPAHKDPAADGDGHHMIAVGWAPGCVHIDDHDQAVLQGCGRGCTDYVQVAGDDPFSAETEESEET